MTALYINRIDEIFCTSFELTCLIIEQNDLLIKNPHLNSLDLLLSYKFNSVHSNLTDLYTTHSCADSNKTKTLNKEQWKTHGLQNRIRKTQSLICAKFMLQISSL